MDKLGKLAWAALIPLISNGVCLLLLTPLRSDDINMVSVWTCSCNDVIGNAGVLVTTGIVAIAELWWLDILFGGSLALRFLRTGCNVCLEAWLLVRAPGGAPE